MFSDPIARRRKIDRLFPCVIRCLNTSSDMQSRNAIYCFPSMRLLRSSVFLRAVLGLTTILVTATFGLAQPAGAKTAPEKPNTSEQTTKDPKLPFTLTVTDDQIIGISLKAENVKLKDIGAELAKRLKIPVFLTPIMEKHAITVDFSELVLEPAMQMLAPQVYIDYETDSTPGTQPRPLAIYLQGYNERAPLDNAVVRGNSDVMVVEGNTEDDGTNRVTDEKDRELKVTVKRGLLSVSSRKQPLVVVLYAIANELGIPLEVKKEVADLVTVNISDASVESAIQQLGPNIKLYVRSDLQLGERRPLRLVLVGPDKTS